MIQTVAGLLASLVAEQLPVLDADSVTHAPTIGDMYEGLSGEVLAKAVPTNLGLRVVTGFATNDTGELSGQIDRMLVQGAGEPIPFTASYKWHVRDIIAAVEVKKSLTRNSLKDAADQLLTIRRIDADYRRSLGDTLSAADEEPAHQAFAEMTGRSIPPVETGFQLVGFDRGLFCALLEESTSVLRVVIGFHGPKREVTLRRQVVDLVETNIRTDGYTPSGLPQLIIAGGQTVIKANGQPFSPLCETYRWPFYGSTGGNPLQMLLEVLWTRLDLRYGLGNPWGDDRTTEVFRALMSASWANDGGREGWAIWTNVGTTQELAKFPTHERWEPEFVSSAVTVVLGLLQRDRDVIVDAPEFMSFAASQGLDAESLAAEVVATRLAARQGSRLILIARDLTIAHLPDGRSVAASNNTGRLSRWVSEYVSGQNP